MFRREALLKGRDIREGASGTEEHQEEVSGFGVINGHQSDKKENRMEPRRYR